MYYTVLSVDQLSYNIKLFYFCQMRFVTIHHLNEANIQFNDMLSFFSGQGRKALACKAYLSPSLINVQQ